MYSDVEIKNANELRYILRVRLFDMSCSANGNLYRYYGFENVNDFSDGIQKLSEYHTFDFEDYEVFQYVNGEFSIGSSVTVNGQSGIINDIFVIPSENIDDEFELGQYLYQVSVMFIDYESNKSYVDTFQLGEVEVYGNKSVSIKLEVGEKFSFIKPIDMGDISSSTKIGLFKCRNFGTAGAEVVVEIFNDWESLEREDWFVVVKKKFKNINRLSKFVDINSKKEVIEFDYLRNAGFV